MSHNQKRTHWYKEGLISLLGGTTHGITSILVGQPMDIIKTKMQTQKNSPSKKLTTKKTFQKIFNKSGIKGFYKGALPPLFGSIIYRSTQFGVFESIFTYFSKDKTMTTPIPYTKGVQPRIIIAAITAGISRSLIECPFEYIKVKKQTNQNWIFKNIYYGFSPLLVRTVGMNLTVFLLIDGFRRNTRFMDFISGQFFVGAFCCSLGWLFVWPFENLKNVVQAGGHGSWIKRFGAMYRINGVRGFYRGLLPGLICVSTRNGASFIVMSQFHRVFTNLGLRK